ncbi:MAG: hypothetical protein KKD25_03905 [Gammaproteobacteria bacterium]|nr:hypothetical protein [Gammaproteobacteria bacterium]MBU0771633.1 hypothetical protein [Gammaproteobacteria bacterium]MBU0856906.1 hypothetical protein [Gammaproteobacteria bacterium]MBU1848207.1 hypothetical protein [Gammaproteobacteria bacterium]
MNIIKPMGTAAFVMFSAAAMAAPTYPSGHMTDTISGDMARGAAQRTSAAEARNEITARPTPIAPAAPADPMYRADNYPNNTGWKRAADAQRANGVSPDEASAEISDRPTPVAPAAPADPKFVPSS